MPDAGHQYQYQYQCTDAPNRDLYGWVYFGFGGGITNQPTTLLLPPPIPFPPYFPGSPRPTLVRSGIAT